MLVALKGMLAVNTAYPHLMQVFGRLVGCKCTAQVLVLWALQVV